MAGQADWNGGGHGLASTIDLDGWRRAAGSGDRGTGPRLAPGETNSSRHEAWRKRVLAGVEVMKAGGSWGNGVVGGLKMLTDDGGRGALGRTLSARSSHLVFWRRPLGDDQRTSQLRAVPFSGLLYNSGEWAAGVNARNDAEGQPGQKSRAGQRAGDQNPH